MSSRMSVNSAGGMTWRMEFSTCAKYCSVSSMRVPAGARTCMRIWPASTCGKKSSPSMGVSARQTRDQDEEAGGHELAMRQRGGEHGAVSVAQLFEPALEGAGEAARFVLAAGFRGEQVAHHGGDERAREEVRGHHRQHDGQRERREQIARGAGEEDHGHEDDADAERGDEGRAWRSAWRHRGWRARSACPCRDCGGCFRFRQWHRPPEFRRRAPCRRGSSR